MDALKASMLLEVSSVTKSEQRLLADLPCMRHALMAKSGKPIERGAGSVQVPFTLPSKFDCPEFVRLQHFSLITPSLVSHAKLCLLCLLMEVIVENFLHHG